MTDEAPTPAVPEFVPNPVPVEIHLKTGNIFVVDDVEAWGYTDEGVFATGRWKGQHKEHDLLIPYDSIEYYDLGFERLKKFLASRQTQEAANADSE